MDDKLASAIQELATVALITGHLPQSHELSGVRPLDLWSEGQHGGMLCWVERAADLCERGEAVLHDVYAKRVDGMWKVSTGACVGADEGLENLRARSGPGLRRHGGSAVGDVRLTWAIAGHGVATVQLRRQNGVILNRVPPRHGMMLFGITRQDPITYAYAMSDDGTELPGEPLLL